MTICRNCNKTAQFNTADEKKGKYCKNHKLEGMINVTIKRCYQKECMKKATYNYINHKPKYCKSHKLENMIDLYSRKCIYENCNSRPSYNYNNIKKPIYCSIHKLENMINVLLKKCIFNTCNKYATYNFINLKKPLYCKIHKLENMVYYQLKKCNFSDCNIYPSYNYINFKKPLYCKIHKLENMVNIISKLCIHSDCNVIACYNYINKSPLYCYSHKLDNMIDVISPRCKTPSCDMHISNKYNGYCKRCFVKLNPDQKLPFLKIKEYTVVNYIIDNFKDYNWIYNQKIQNGKSTRIPDLLLDIGYQIIIIEIDEKQHKYYNKNEEELRMKEICSDLLNRPIVFIHFNPDGYIDKYNNKIKSCWKFTNNKYFTLINKRLWNHRLLTLKSEIIFWLNPLNKLDTNIKIVNLFFDSTSYFETNIIYFSDLSSSDNESIHINKSYSSHSLHSEPNIIYFSDLSSSDDEPSHLNKSYSSHSSYSEPNIIYFSDLSSSDSDTEITKSISYTSDLNNDQNFNIYS
jgi:hypothetical protein